MTVPASPFVYRYPELIPGTLRKRYKRFLADIELASGEIVTAHCPNTGPMTGVCELGAPVMLSKSDNPKRKLAYTWEMIQLHTPEPTWVGVNTALPNRVIKAMLLAKQIPELADHYDTVRPEVRYGTANKSRIDFLLTGEGRSPLYVEVKNTTWTKGDLALFPDTETTRGQKHLQELIDIVPGAKAVMLYFINRGDCTRFAPGDSKDPKYGELFRQAIAAGIQILPCRFAVSPEGIRYLGLASWEAAEVSEAC
ncbi:sugar fermentation stimulation protein SfsA [Picosynechococcus sp. PCC 7003]|uniref:DNA/RNA nuclease SfsA n=1 Tax=Picosynechococcus sp. PCC 7003 TaxID=374981 RepID=UPI000810BC92|nr:DNA/RNA nuclease SfsA [Picosynechococcus sp. PCC 7003]ANV84599.1 sugar fermentation stimulation protein SfsA [Picosynechococcus sp. PCC 7003]